MKRLLLILAAFPLIMNAQDTNGNNTMLDPVEIRSTTMGKSVIAIPLKEKQRGEFEKDPVTFMVNNVDATEIFKTLQDEAQEGFIVTFKTRKGQLSGNYDGRGQLHSYSMNFKNIALPRDITWQLYDQYKGWEMIENTRIVRNGNTPNYKETYRIVMQNGKSKKTVKIDRSSSSDGKLVLNY